MTQSSLPVPTATAADEPWRTEAGSWLRPGETVLAGLALDLDARLHFTQGWLVVTDQRIVARAPGEKNVREWNIAPALRLSHTDHAGVGTLELSGPAGRLATWRYTLGYNPAALRLADQFEAQRDAAASRPVTGAGEVLCPTCKAPLPPDEEQCPQCSRELETPPSTWALLRLWRFARPYRWQLLGGFLLTLLSTAATLVPPYLTMPLMDRVLIPFQNGVPIDYGLVRLYLAGLLGAALVAWSLGWARTYLLARVSERIGADLRTTTYEHLLKLSLEYFGGKRTGDLMARIGSESDRICVFLSLHLLDFATDVLMILMTAVILVSINPWLALVTLVPLPFIAWMIHLVRDRLRHGFEKIDRIWSEITNVLADTIPGIRVVKAFAQEKREVTRFREANKHNLAINDRVNAVWSLFTPTVTLLTEIGLLIVWVFGIWQVSHSAITVGVLVAFLTYISRFYTRLDSMSRIVSVTQKAAAGAKRIFDILDHVSSVPEPTRPARLDRVEGAIDMSDLGFRYGNRAVIRGLNLSIAPGEMIGLVGHSGSGKSTLVNLICRFYDVSEGAIRVDGVDIRSLPVSEYRRHIGLVLQEPFLFFGTIADNIAYGKPDATRDEIIAAARAAHAHEFILRLPHGYDSLVGERGQALSGGERQRISIARALLINPRILIMDEATSSVDTATEKEIQKALDNLVQGRTTIAIAHRLSTLRKADRLVVMDRGQIVEVGSHDELLLREGAYYKLYQAQARNVDTEDDDTEQAIQLPETAHAQ
ncbi:putative ABC transporter, ATP-binding membrane component [Cupriavidus taiwanensis]|uniref:ABC transporter, ATP-binding membrane component n=1 Tax=Cupriavidus taiwanensis TaxID=164546 RepID=A0A375DW71_9BURK|nr:ABC transporter ATP-binding protein [Cupriavidus taiwanensis]SOZ15452.1 putative ABC transporter, ATP-binding membrane component [Cupriavidus taiwanensis]SOZ27695.1 putative ABC transporter, ATP-binding membrane component [Cupriavidus taiwanensis]SOZ46022.1 putative ABC transporter, ATP-binding membrane component [Cupriavidus taiwanensis]SOZ48665.1 putative ABC transporter, ATP-binding membrane component [Cupriavidus taiwanensis]SOZ49043.1 putative ABC transporter, ATP-binding membrane comp